MKQIETSDKVLELALKILLAENADFAAAFARCESPIEQLFLASVVHIASCTEGVCFGASAVDAASNRAGYGSVADDLHDCDIVASVQNGRRTLVLLQQPTLKCNGHDIRPDFAIVALSLLGSDSSATTMSRVAVELDGHDWHERTKEQAASDKRRDRMMVAEGWSVMRFTGSEVYLDAADCFWEACTAVARFGAISWNSFCAVTQSDPASDCPVGLLPTSTVHPVVEAH